MTRTHARLLATCSLTLLTVAGVGCGSDDTKGPMMSAAAAGSAAPAPSGAAMNPSTESPSTGEPPASSGSPMMQPNDSKPPSGTPGEPTDEPGMEQPSAGEPGDKPGSSGMGTDTPAGMPYPDLRGTCDIESAYPGDDTCISKPSEDEGMQLHVGPANYDDPAEVEKFIMQPGDESSECWTFQTPNTEDVWYQSSVLSGRAGTHHIINYMLPAGATPNGGFGPCTASGQAIGSIPGASKAYMPRGQVAPEYADVGRKIVAQATIQSDMHYFNFTDKPILREYWLNIYFAPKDSVMREAQPIRGFGGLGWNQEPIPPGTDNVYKYACPIKGNGHIMNLLGHYHAHGKRFTASIQRAGSGEVEKVFEMFDYLEPAVFEYNTVVQNPMFADGSAGAVSGQLAVADGDQLLWECHIINDSDVGLTYTNEVKTGEMCNIWGATIGVERISCNLR